MYIFSKIQGANMLYYHVSANKLIPRLKPSYCVKTNLDLNQRLSPVSKKNMSLNSHFLLFRHVYTPLLLCQIKR